MIDRCIYVQSLDKFNSSNEIKIIYAFMKKKVMVSRFVRTKKKLLARYTCPEANQRNSGVFFILVSIQKRSYIVFLIL